MTQTAQYMVTSLSVSTSSTCLCMHWSVRDQFTKIYDKVSKSELNQTFYNHWPQGREGRERPVTNSWLLHWLV